MPYQEAQLCFMELVQMLLFLSASVAACTKEMDLEELSTNQRKGQACQASFYIVIEGVTAVGFVPSVFIF